MVTFQEECLVIQELPVEGYDKVYKIEDPSVQLEAIICLHDLTLGPALGGTRIYPYPDFESALTDAKRLARGMTYKSAVAGCGLGGGKSVIIADPAKDKTPELLRSFGRAIDLLEGIYIAAEDVGCSTEDVGVMASTTKYVVGLTHDKSSGNPSYFTAWGVYRGIQACLKKLYGSDSVKGRKIAIQGLGSVGSILMDLLFWGGAELVVADVNVEKAKRLAQKYGATLSTPEEILSVPCDILSPCALGGIINPKNISQLQCKAIAGAANNQLLSDSDGDLLMERGILYSPDFVINAGGLINVAEETCLEGYSPVLSLRKVDALYDLLLTIFDSAEEKGISTHQAALDLGDYRLKNKIGKRTEKPYFHHCM